MVCPYSFDYPGGVQAHILDLARILTGRGHEVQVLGPGRPSLKAQSGYEIPDYVTLGGEQCRCPITVRSPESHSARRLS